VTWHIPIITLALIAAIGPKCQAQAPSEPQTPGEKVEKEFYTPKDRIEAIRAALIFTPRSWETRTSCRGPSKTRNSFNFISTTR